MQIGDQIEIHIDAYSHEGWGVGRVDGFVIMVPGALCNERCKVQIRELFRSYATADLLQVRTSSPERREPFCPYFTKCGGCDLQHMSYEESLRLKRQTVTDALQRLGGFSQEQLARVSLPVGMEHPYQYRNNVQYHSDQAGGFGFYERGSHKVVPVSQCPLQSDLSNRLYQTVRRALEKQGVDSVLHIVIRVSLSLGQAMLVLVTDERDFQDSAEKDKKVLLLSEITASVPECVSIYHSIQKKNEPRHRVFGSRMNLVSGQQEMADTIGCLRFQISPQAFFQVNPVQTEVLYSTVAEYAGLTGTEQVYDLYCGTGTIALFLAERAGSVTGVEVVPQAIENARKNMLLNQVENAAFVCAKAEVYLPTMVRKGLQADVAVVDPPRAGCDRKLLDALLEVQPKRIVYVSCDPGTLARDLKRLAAGGYAVKQVRVVDMFGWSKHVETVVLMSRTEK